MHGKTIALILSCIFLIGPSSLYAQTKVFKIGLASWVVIPSSMQGFKDGLAEEGLIEGENVEFFAQESNADKKKQQNIAQQFRRIGVDLVYSITTTGTLIMKKHMPSQTPIVFSVVSYPKNVGLIKSFNRSGTNLVGTSNFVEPANFIRVLTTILPDAKTVAIFRRKNEPNSIIQKNVLSKLLKKEGLHFIDVPATSKEDLKIQALQIAPKVDAFIATQDTLLQGGGEDALIEVSLEKKIPILSSLKTNIERGSTFGPVADFYTLGKMSGKMAAAILNDNVNPALMESKMQDPPLVLINKRSVEILGLTIPENQLQNFKYVE